MAFNRIFSLLAFFAVFATSTPASQLLDIRIPSTVNSALSNVHLAYYKPIRGEHKFTYGPCEGSNSTGPVIFISPGSNETDVGAHRFVWVISDDSLTGGCISAWESDSNELLGRSDPINFAESHPNLKRDGVSIQTSNDSGIDAEGPWFDGVKLLKNKEIGAVDVKVAKSKRIGIIGGGISGLMSYYLLRNVGFKNIHISESTERIGGRIRTEYFDDEPASAYQYQELGAMRIPLSIELPTNKTLNFTDHDIVFQLAELLNHINKNEPELLIKWIPFYNTPADGGDSASSTTPSDPAMAEFSEKLNEIKHDPEMWELVSENIYAAHKKFLDMGLDGKGGDDWSESAYIHNFLKYSLNITDQALQGGSLAPFWVNVYDDLYFSATKWRTIDQGMSRLPNAFQRIIEGNIDYNRKIEKVKFSPEDGTVQVSWKNNFMNREWQNATYDYALVTAPFTAVRKWRELPAFSPTLSNAISYLNYQPACKLFVQFKDRFWEHLPNPIYGTCNTVNANPGLGNICYPSFNLNSTGPAYIIGSYVNTGDWAERWVSTSEEEHTHNVLEALSEIHGDIVWEKYTGKSSRQCWLLDESTGGGAWAFPNVGQHKLYIPSYFNTENNVIFIGEHTAYTHSWIASALESAVRGTVQLLLELGLVDEAKQITQTWMGRWIRV